MHNNKELDEYLLNKIVQGRLKVAVVGRVGCGKTVFINTITQNMNHIVRHATEDYVGRISKQQYPSQVFENVFVDVLNDCVVFDYSDPLFSLDGDYKNIQEICCPVIVSFLPDKFHKVEDIFETFDLVILFEDDSEYKYQYKVLEKQTFRKNL